MEQLPGLPETAFDKVDPSPDAEFYAYPRFVTHIDDEAIAAVTRVYRERLPQGGAVLDLMSSWVSHLPEDIAYTSVVGHGMNEEELAANPRLSRWFVQDLNIEADTPSRRRGIRRRLSVRVCAVPAATGRRIPGGSPRTATRCAVRGVVLQPVLSDQGCRDLAVAFGAGPAAPDWSLYEGSRVRRRHWPGFHAAAGRPVVDCDQRRLERVGGTRRSVRHFFPPAVNRP